MRNNRIALFFFFFISLHSESAFSHTNESPPLEIGDIVVNHNVSGGCPTLVGLIETAKSSEKDFTKIANRNKCVKFPPNMKMRIIGLSPEQPAVMLALPLISQDNEPFYIFKLRYIKIRAK